MTPPDQSFDRRGSGVADAAAGPMREPAIENGFVALRAPLLFDPAGILRSLRSMNGIERNDRVWAFAAGISAPIFGSLLSVLVWSAFVWNVASAVVGRYPLRLGRIGRAGVAAAGAYGAVKLGFTIVHSGIDSWRIWPAFLVFFAPAFFLFRQRISNGAVLFDLLVLGAGISVIIAAPASVVETLLTGERPELFCGNSNVFAVMSALFGAIGSLNVVATSRRRQWLGLLAFLAMVFCVFISGRRTMWLAIPFLTMTIVWAAAHVMPRRALWRGVIAVLFVTTIGMLAGSGMLRERIAEFGEDIAKMEQSGDFESSTGRRILMFRGAWLAIGQAPFAGYGVEGRMDAVRAHVPARYRDLVGFTHPHNAYLAALLDAGILGLVILFTMLTAPVWLSSMAPRDATWRPRLAAGMILTLCYAISGIAGIMFEHDLMDAAFMAVLIAIMASAEEAELRHAGRE
ncbi:MAG: hypothetical protein Kow0026_23420 [Oricola sp.]